MTLISPAASFTPDDVLALEDEGLYELVDGKLVEQKTGSLASKTAGLITIAVGTHLKANRAGEVYPELTFQCFPHDSELLRRPDVAVVLADRVGEVPDEGHVKIAPDIAIEVVSLNDKIYELDRKLADYRSAGVKLVWVVNPEARTIRIHRPDHTVTELTESDTLVGEVVLPGFAAKVMDLLAPKKSPSAPG